MSLSIKVKPDPRHSFKHLFNYSFIKLLRDFCSFESFAHGFRSEMGDFYLT